MQNALKEYAAGSEIAVTKVLKSLSLYVSVLRRHTHRVGRPFLPMVEKGLSSKDKKRLKSHFLFEEARIDTQRITIPFSKGQVIDINR